MKVFVTGAAGFVGRYVVDALVDAGHDVTAMVRRPISDVAPWRAHGVDVVVGDLNSDGPWQEALAATDAIVHLAAAKEGDLAAHIAGTVVGTERLLAQAERSGVGRLVHISSFSVYDHLRHARRVPMTEHSALEAAPQRREAYAEAKLEQERLVREFGARGNAVTILRPGFVWGPGQLWDGGTLLSLRTFGIMVSPRSAFKLIYVENLAQAVAAALEAPSAIGEVINLVDTEQPTMWTFHRALRSAGGAVPAAIPVPWWFAAPVAAALDRVNARFLDGRARLPFYLVPAKLAPRARPLRASNEHATRVLGWRPGFSLDEAIRRSVERS